ncbi:MAG: NUDIX hydrolase [Methanobrevibacter sp.]|nr:NUDIX hydrolase [Methanobrevibacter sp.]
MKDYKKPSVTVDMIISNDKLNKNSEFVLIRRKNEPYKNQWAIPGGFVEYGETTENSAIREAKEETNIDITIDKLFGVYSDPKRDPRGHTITIVYLAIGNLKKLKASSDASDGKIYSFNDIDSLELAFDHKKILKEIYDRLNSLAI